MGRLGRKNTSRICLWGYSTRKRCREVATEHVDTPKTRAYYCPHHAGEARRIFAGGGR